MITETITITRVFGEDESPAALLVQKAGEFSSRITVKYQNNTINAKSIMGVMVLSLAAGAALTICAEGDDADLALEGIKGLLLA